ncbi:hypothetical protein DFH29DRAFT_1049286 [Suillus ampliporus]|nr:hypothetical protein DFH29DRAFT_1049286 [Suillus ampliporus]
MSSVGLGAMFYLSPTADFSLGAVFYGRYLKKLLNQTQEAMGEMTKVTQESLSALRTEGKFHDRVTWGTLVLQGAITVGDLTSLLLYTLSIMRGIGAGMHIFELLDRTPAILPHGGIKVDPSRYRMVRFENIAFEYPSRKGVRILDDFNLEIGIGESVAIV